MVYLLSHQDDLIIYVITSRCFGYRQCVEDAARHCEPFVNPHKQAHKIACHLSGHISKVCNTIHLRSSSWVVSMTFTSRVYNVGYCMQIDADVAEYCRPWPLGGCVHKLARMHKTIHTEVRSSCHIIVSIHRLAWVHKTPYTRKAVECRTRRKARQAVKETIHSWLQDRQPPGRHRTVAQWLPNGSVSKRADCWEVHTGQVNLFNTVATGK